jgi:bifunctional DNase/RNase
MKKVKLEIVGLSYSQTQSGAYVLVLAESESVRRLPIIIGGFEAQSIAIELEKVVTLRPITHDLFKNLALFFSIQVIEVVIYDLIDGIFFSKIICKQNDFICEIDARTSDAIAIGVRFECPIYTYENILEIAGILLEEDYLKTDETLPEEEKSQNNVDYKSLSVEELENNLDKAIKNEDYETASKIRDEINKRL